MPLVNIKKSIQTSSDDFNYLAKNSLLVDKSLLIKDFWEGEQVSLITRPRRFGKTLALSMLQYFFVAKDNPEEHKERAALFNNFAIATATDQNGKNYIEEHQGKYPVIFITFKDIKENTFVTTINKIKLIIQEIYREHENLSLNSKKISSTMREKFEQYLNGKVNEQELTNALKFLSEFLHKALGKKVIILIDEYDSPLTSAYGSKHLEDLSKFFSNLFSAALKTNPHLEKGLMTGILRISKNSMLSGLNNLETYTLLDQKYKEYFGFTEHEVEELIKVRSVTQTPEQIRSFYNGYKIGSIVIYNPWSVMKFFSKKELGPYWLLTNNDQLLKNILLNSDINTKQLLGELIQGKTITGEVDINLRYEDLIENTTALWTLLLFGGYLTIESSKLSLVGTAQICQLRIPNQEVLRQYNQVFSEWLEMKIKQVKNIEYDLFLKSLVEGRVEEFTKSLTGYLFSCTSSYDFQAESDYHSFMLGLLVSIKQTHFLFSNKEFATGRPDCLLIPKDPTKEQGIILEFKHIHFKFKDQNKDVDFLKEQGHQYAQEGLTQIETRGYSYGLAQHPQIKSILKVGIAFSNRIVSSAYKKVEIENGEEKGIQPESPLQFFDAEQTEYSKRELFESNIKKSNEEDVIDETVNSISMDTDTQQKSVSDNTKKRTRHNRRIDESDDEEMFQSQPKISSGLLPFSSQDTHWHTADETLELYPPKNSQKPLSTNAQTNFFQSVPYRLHVDDTQEAIANREDNQTIDSSPSSQKL